MEAIHENRLINALVRGLPRSECLLNAVHESDAELIRLPGQKGMLAITADAVVEEIELGLYTDPFHIGWMTVTAAASDLAAVGASPVGILLIETLPAAMEASARDRLQQGIRDACVAYDLPVLGGDTNSAPSLHVAAVALGMVSDDKILTRLGVLPGHTVCTTGRLGLGSAFAALRMRGADVPFEFRPHAQLAAGRLLRMHASCCMDTSDGGFAALDQLMRLNGAGFRLENSEDWVHPVAARMAEEVGLPSWMMLAGLHGEFELLFCLPEEAFPVLRREARRAGWEPLRIGTAVERQRIEVTDPMRTVAVDTARVRNLFARSLPPFNILMEELHASIESLQ